MNKIEFEEKMHAQTELPGDFISEYDLQFISHRYKKVVPLVQDKNILEIGVGSIIGKKELASLSNLYVGADLTHKNLINCTKGKVVENLNLVRMDAHHIPFESDSFDLVIALAMIYYLDIDEFLREVKRVLKPGGKIFFCTSNKDLPGFVASPFTKDYYSVDELNNKLLKQGFRAQFEGAFQEYRVSFYGKIFAFLKNRLKKLFFAFFGDDKLWLKLRTSYKGAHVIIPSSLDDFPINDITSHKINSYEKNYKYKIIYCTASTDI